MKIWVLALNYFQLSKSPRLSKHKNFLPLSILCYLFISSSYAFAGDLCEDLFSFEDVQAHNSYLESPVEIPLGSVQYTMAQLSARGQLIDQSDDRLEARNLLIPGGGLCASTCAVNIMHALFDYARIQPNPIQAEPDYYIQSILHELLNLFQIEARKPITFTEMRPALKKVVGQVTSRKRDFGSSILKLSKYNFYEDSFVSKPNAIKLLAVTVGSSGHAIILLGINPRLKKLAFIDPNDPKEIHYVNYTVSSLGHQQTINISWDGIFGKENSNGFVTVIMDIWLNQSVSLPKGHP